MKVLIKEQGQVSFDTTTSKKSIVIGRGSQCDFIIKNDHISRAHVEILNKDDGVYFQNLTTNWCFLNNKNITKGSLHRVLSIDVIELPGEILIKVEKEADQDAEDFKPKRKLKKMTRVSAKDSIGKRVGKNPQKENTHLEAIKKILPMMIALLVVGGYIGYKQYTREPYAGPKLTKFEELQQKRAKAKWKKIQKASAQIDDRVKAARKTIQKKEVKNLLERYKCQSELETKLCLLLGRYGKNEGFIVQNGIAYAFLDYDKRVLDKFNEDVFPGLEGIPKDYLYEVMASYYFLAPSFLKEIRKLKGFDKMIIQIVDTSDLVHETLKTYMIDLTDTLNHTEVKHHVALNGILKEKNRDYFVNYLSIFLLEVK